MASSEPPRLDERLRYIEDRLTLLEKTLDNSSIASKVANSKNDTAKKEMRGDVVELEARVKSLEDRIVRLQRKGMGWFW